MATPAHCPTCKTSSSFANPRNLAVFIDGTSNKPGEKNTNVFKLYSEAMRNSSSEGSGPEQHAFYLKGLGAREDVSLPPLIRMSQGIYSALEMGLAWNVKQNVEDAYSWLVETYRDGDRIFLFGFSRGAYQVRSLASMIHEVGLTRDKHRVDTAYQHYRSIDPLNDETRVNAVNFKKNFCWQGVRVHFIGVWDTVSSLGLIKKDVHITSSATVTNACHFRHALALDERRVKFMPEYFTEVNTHYELGSPRLSMCDVEEVWFAGSHADVGGASRPHSQAYSFHTSADPASYPVHAGNISLQWMKQEAITHGLLFKKVALVWDPEDVHLGRRDSMTSVWKILEMLPIRQQVSFSGTGKHARRFHWFRPRSVIPSQQIHASIFSSDVYFPNAVLGDGVGVPTAPRRGLGELWVKALRDEEITTQLSGLLIDYRRTLGSLEKVLFLMDYMLDNGQTVQMNPPPWFRDIREQTGLNMVSLTIIYDVISELPVPEELLEDAKRILRTVLRDQTYPAGLFYVVRFLAKHHQLRDRYADTGVTEALIIALERTAKNTGDSSFPLVVDSLCHLINDQSLRNDVVMQLNKKLSTALKTKGPAHLMASLKMIACLALNERGVYGDLKTRIITLAKGCYPIGPAALETLVVLKASRRGLTTDTLLPDWIAEATGRIVPIANILAYLGNFLHRLDAEVEDTSPPTDIRLPYVLQADNSDKLDERVMLRLVSALKSSDTCKRTAATLALLKLCRNTAIRDFCSQRGVFEVFAKQLKAKETCLLAAYALKACIEQGITKFDFDDVVQSVITMLSKGWFDDVVGRLEGFKILQQLISVSDDLKKRIIVPRAVDTLVERLGDGEPHVVRMCLRCLDMLEISSILQRLTDHVETSIGNLLEENGDIRARSVNILSELAQTAAGEQVISLSVLKIVKMLPRSATNISDSQAIGPTVVLRNLCKNEKLRLLIHTSDEFNSWKREYCRATPQ